MQNSKYKFSMLHKNTLVGGVAVCKRESPKPLRSKVRSPQPIPQSLWNTKLWISDNTDGLAADWGFSHLPPCNTILIQIWYS